jgi:hypothetical protein
MLRQWFQLEKKTEAADQITATETYVAINPVHVQDKKRPDMFTLIIEHEGGRIAVALNSDVLGQWKKQISELSHAYWCRGQALPYAKYGVS